MAEDTDKNKNVSLRLPTELYTKLKALEHDRMYTNFNALCVRLLDIGYRMEKKAFSDLYEGSDSQDQDSDPNVDAKSIKTDLSKDVG